MPCVLLLRSNTVFLPTMESKLWGNTSVTKRSLDQYSLQHLWIINWNTDQEDWQNSKFMTFGWNVILHVVNFSWHVTLILHMEQELGENTGLYTAQSYVQFQTAASPDWTWRGNLHAGMHTLSSRIFDSYRKSQNGSLELSYNTWFKVDKFPNVFSRCARE